MFEVVYLFVGFLAIGPPQTPQTSQAIANAVDYQLELDLKTLLLKINQPWNKTWRNEASIDLETLYLLARFPNAGRC